MSGKVGVTLPMEHGGPLNSEPHVLRRGTQCRVTEGCIAQLSTHNPVESATAPMWDSQGKAADQFSDIPGPRVQNSQSPIARTRQGPQLDKYWEQLCLNIIRMFACDIQIFAS